MKVLVVAGIAIMMAFASVTLGCSCKPPAGDTITVQITVDCRAPVDAGIAEVRAICPSGIMFDGSVVIPEGTSALAALEATGLRVSKAPGAFAYVTGINGLAERITSAYPTSGWMFYVNGEMAMEACDVFVLNDGDTVLWKYSLTYE